MKFSIKGAISFFLGLVIISLVAELIESSMAERVYNFDPSKLIRYAVIAAIYGCWKGWKSNKEQKEVKK